MGERGEGDAWCMELAGCVEIILFRGEGCLYDSEEGCADSEWTLRRDARAMEVCGAGRLDAFCPR